MRNVAIYIYLVASIGLGIQGGAGEAVAAEAANNIGIYFNESGTTNCLEPELTYPQFVSAYIILKNVIAQGGIGGWEAIVDWDSTLYVSLVMCRGQALNFGTFPELIVGLGTPIPADSCVVLAELQIVATGPGRLYLKPASQPLITGADSPIFVFGASPDRFALTSYAYGDTNSACATMGLLDCPSQNDYSDALPDSVDSGELVIVAEQNALVLPERDGPFPFSDLTFASPELRSVLARVNAISIDRVFARSTPREIIGNNGQTVQLLGGNDAFVFRLENQDKCVFEDELAELGAILSVEPNTAGGVLQDDVDDPGFQQQWAIVGPNSADILDAWDYSYSNPTVTISVIDRGAYAIHPEFLGKRSGDTSYYGDHGAEVAGIAGAITNNGIGIAGVARGAHVNFQYTDTTPSSLVAAVADALAFQPQIMNHSYEYLGGGSGSILHRLFIDAYKLGTLHTIAAGNSYTYGDPLIYPARFGWAWHGYDQGMVVVAGSNVLGDVFATSSSGPHTDISAPGAGVISTTNNSSHPISAPLDGTSFAAPHAAGAAALLLTAWPQLTPDDVDAIFKLSAKDLGPEGFDERTGWGLLQAGDAFDLLNTNSLNHLEYTLGGAQEHEADSWLNVVLEGFPGISGSHHIYVVRVTDHITFPQEYTSPPAVWGRGNGSTGLGDYPWYNVNYTGVVDGSVTTTGCTVETYIYRFAGTQNYLPNNYYPFSQVTWAISVLGHEVPVSVDENGERVAATPKIRMDGPNPFNAKISFAVELPSNAEARVYVCDLRGMIVKEYPVDQQNENWHRYEWDGRDRIGKKCASGVYIVVGESGENRTEHKIVLAK